jgi:hypothetical protein
MDQQAVLTDSTADFWPRVPLHQPADRSRAPLHRLTPGFRMRGAERNNDMISVANAIQGPVVVRMSVPAPKSAWNCDFAVQNGVGGKLWGA